MGGNGNAGGTTFFDSLAFANGGGYGMGGTSGNTIPGGSAGGGPLIDTFNQYTYGESGSATLNSPFFFRMLPQYNGPGYGGCGQNNLSVLSAGAQFGNRSACANGGNPGSVGTNSGGNLGGGGGGGGAAGGYPGATGGNGGNGGNGNGGGAGGAGIAGTAGIFGSGGGGGGAGGCGTTSTQPGGAGGAGGNGFILIRWIF